MTWPELEQAGAVVRDEGPRPVFAGPPEMAERVRAAIYERRTLMVSPPKITTLGRVAGRCDTCSGGLAGRASGGWCPLCTAARIVALREASRG